ncbi:MAG: hypothetical protein WA184_20625 [Stellaceae bacterium]
MGSREAKAIASCGFGTTISFWKITAAFMGDPDEPGCGTPTKPSPIEAEGFLPDEHVS